MSAFVLKIIGIISMLMDHIGYLIFGNVSFFNYIGRFAFPIFAFQISEGYIHTSNLKRYFLRLLAFAFISQIPFMLFHSMISTSFSLNIFFTLLLGLASIYIYDKSKYKVFGIAISILFALIAKYTNCDYGFYGVAIILLFYIFKNNILYANIIFILATLIKYLIPCVRNGFYDIYLYLFIFTCLSSFFIATYNGKKGKNTEYLLYLFYPIHLLVIYGFSLII